MAGRPKKAETDYKVSLRKVGTYRYASSHPYVTDEKTGQRIRRYVNWGELTEDLKFIPFDRYIIATDEERNRLMRDFRIAGIEAEPLIRREAADEGAADKGAAHSFGGKVVGDDLVVCLQTHRGGELGQVDQRVGALTGVIAPL